MAKIVAPLLFVAAALVACPAPKPAVVAQDGNQNPNVPVAQDANHGK